MLVKDTRDLARIVRIDAIEPIPRADLLEVAVVGGWKCVVSKGLYKVGDSALYFEIDSAVPANSPVFDSFDKKHLRIVEDAQYKNSFAIIKTLRLRSVLSQGLLLSSQSYAHTNIAKEPIGTNVTAKLEVLKYVSPEEAHLYKVDDVSDARGEQSATRKIVWAIRAWLIKGITVDGHLPFPTGIPKSDQPRVQNIFDKLNKWREAGHTCEYTIKLNGESLTYYTDIQTKQVGVAQRNFALRTDDVDYTPAERRRVFAADLLRYVARKVAGGQVTFPRWKKGYLAQSVPAVRLFYRDNMLKRLNSLNEDLAGPNPTFPWAAGLTISVQGEGVGPSFHKNAENQPIDEFYVYNVYGSGAHKFLPTQARQIAKSLGLLYVPVLDEEGVIPEDIQALLKKADGPGHFDKNRPREGIVGKNNITGLSFKVISNKWLEKKSKKENAVEDAVEA